MCAGTRKEEAMVDWKLMLCALIVGGVIGWLLAPRISGTNWQGLLPGSVPVPIAGPVVRDTIPKIILRERLVVHEAPARVVERRDTMVQYEGPHDTLSAEPFVLQTDTVLHRAHGDDSVTMRTSFPPPRQSLVVRSSPDTALTLRETQFIYIPVPVEKPIPWWQDVLKIGIGVGLGYGAAKIDTVLER